MASCAYLISIAIPSYNGSATIREAIQTIAIQPANLLKATEVLVVDDASTDETASIARDAGRSLSNFRLHQNPNRLGITANWNACLRLAQGEFILLLHQDDALLPHALPALHNLLQSDPALGMAFGNTEIVAEGPGFRRFMPGWRRGHIFEGTDYARHFCKNGNFIACSSVLYRRASIERAGFFDERLTMLEDVELWLRLALTGWKVGFAPQAIARMRFHSASAAHSAIRQAQTVQDVEFVLERHAEPLAGLGKTGDSPLENFKRQMAFQFLGWGKAAELHRCRTAAKSQWRKALNLAEGLTGCVFTRMLSKAFLCCPWICRPARASQWLLARTGIYGILHRHLGGPRISPPTIVQTETNHSEG